MKKKSWSESCSLLCNPKKDKKSLKKQKLINFSKIWFFHDHIYKTNQKPDKEFLKLIEEKYKVDLRLLVSNERFFNKWNQYYEFSSDEKLSILEQECKLFEKIFRESFVLELAWEEKIEYKIDNRIRQDDTKKISFFTLIRKYLSKKVRTFLR